MSLILSPARTSKAEHRSGVPPSKYDRIRDFLAERGAPEFRYRQVLEAIFRHRIGHFSNMAALPSGLRQELTGHFGPAILNLRRVATRHSDQAEKALYEMEGRHRVEAVALKFRAGWESFCISSQAGCAFGCSFCATGKIGLKRNMTADEITDQLLDFHLLGHTIDSVAFMGMGEPLSNVHLFAALDLMTRKNLFGMSARRITVSTIGVVPSIEKLGMMYPQVNLTVSLHSPFDDQRSLMMPINRKYPIAHLMDALDAHLARTRRKSYLAYVLIDGVNDSREHAKALADLIARQPLRRELLQVSLIRFNQAPSISEGYLRSRQTSIQRFQAVLDRAGVKSTLRASFGNDIEAACGQLSAEYTSKTLTERQQDDHPSQA